MERYVRAELGLTEDEMDADEMDDFALFHPLPYVLQTWSAWRQHGVLPESGGMNEQSTAWGEDRMQMDRLYAVTLNRLLPEMKSQYQSAPSEDAAEHVSTWEDWAND